MIVWTLQEADYDIYEAMGVFSSKEEAILTLLSLYPAYYEYSESEYDSDRDKFSPEGVKGVDLYA